MEPMILLTGGTGFVGSHVAQALAKQGTPFRALVRNPSPVKRLPPSAEVVEGDLTASESISAAVAGCQTVIHCAAITGDRKGDYDLVNRVGTENLVEAARAAGVERLVVMSGLGTRPAPAGTYMATRWAMEEAIRASGIKFVILQPSVLFGSGAPFVEALARLIKQSPVVPLLGGGGLRFQPLWIDDLVRCVLDSLGPKARLGIEVPLGGADVVTFREVIETIAKALGKRPLLAPLPMAIARPQAAIMAALMPKPPLTPAALELFGFDNVAGPESVRDGFGFEPAGFRAHIAANGLR